MRISLIKTVLPSIRYRTLNGRIGWMVMQLGMVMELRMAQLLI